MKHLRESVKLFRYRAGKLLLFELLLHFAGLALLFPLYYVFVNASIRLAGIRYLSRENVVRYLMHPTTYLLFILFILIIALFFVFHVTAVISYLHAARHSGRTGVFRMMKQGMAGLLRTLRPRNLPLLLFICFYIPVSFSLLIGADILNLKLPAYIVDIIRFKGKMGMVYTLVFLVINLFFLRNLSLLHVYTLEKKSFFAAFRESGEEVKKSRRYGWSIFWIFAFFGGTFFLNHLFAGVIMRRVLYIRGFITIYKLIYQSVSLSLFLVFWLFAVPLVLSGISVSYEGMEEEEKEEKEEKKEKAEGEDEEGAGNRKGERLFLLGILLVSLLLNSGFFLLRRLHVFSLNAEYLDTVTITAHRGNSSERPENTLAAFRSAVENGADVVEMDVRQTKDGVVVISHDENIRRVSGVNKKIGKMTYAELQDCSAGAYFGKGYENEPFPTLEEAVELIGDGARLNIELKPESTDTDLEERVVQIVEDHDLIDRCVVTSKNYRAIRKIKQLNEKIRTVYVMSVAMGDFYTLKYADAFSIKYTYIDSQVVKNAHKHGKEVYAWTVDSQAGLKKMMMLHVDSIITNKPYEMRQMMLEIYYSNTLYDSIADLFQ